MKTAKTAKATALSSIRQREVRGIPWIDTGAAKIVPDESSTPVSDAQEASDMGHPDGFITLRSFFVDRGVLGDLFSLRRWRYTLSHDVVIERAGSVGQGAMETTGCGTALITPFRGDGSLDERALYALVNWQVDSGIDFLVACGSTGEAATLDEDEWLSAIQIVIDAAAGRVPVWAGLTHNSTRTLLKKAEKLRRVRGVDAVLSANPYYNKPTQEGQFQHFLALAKAVDPMPVVLYNVPGRTAANLEPETIVRLAEAAENIVGVKEASGKLTQIAALVHSTPRTGPSAFKIFSGDDNLALAAIGSGAQGLISVASNEAPAEVGRMVRAALRNEWPLAREIERKYARLFEANFWESNPAPVKTILSIMGRCEATVRLPLVAPDRAMRQKLERLAGELGLLREAPLPEGDMRMF